MSHMGDRMVGADSFHADQDQIREIERYANQFGATVEILEPELSVSGGKPIDERPSLLRAIEGVEAGEYDGIVVAYLSRLTRSRSGLEIWDRVEAAGGHVHSAQENLDTSTPSGRFIRDIHLANAVREREEHVDRFQARRVAATRAGIWQRRQTPIGYRRDPGTRRLVPDERAGEVQAAFRDRAAGERIVALADRLGMTAGGVRAMLRNRVYLGELQVGQETNPAAHPALVTVEGWEAAQGLPRPPRALAGGVALLAGLARCEACGHVMLRDGSDATRSYRCAGRSSAGRCPRPAAITVGSLEQHVTEIALAEVDRISLSSGHADNGAAAARERLLAAEAELAGFVQAVSVEDVGAEVFADGARVRRQAVDDARADLRRSMAVRPIVPVFESGADAWEALDDHGRNQLLRALLEVVVVRDAGGRGRRVPVGDRVRVIARGAALDLVERRAGRAAGIRPLPFPDLGDEHVLGIPGT